MTLSDRTPSRTRGEPRTPTWEKERREREREIGERESERDSYYIIQDVYYLAVESRSDSVRWGRIHVEPNKKRSPVVNSSARGNKRERCHI